MNRSEIVPWLLSGWRLIALCVVALIIGGLLWWAYSDDSKKEGQLIGNIGAANGQNAVITNLVANQSQEVENAAKNTNQAVNALHDSVNRNSSTFRGNVDDAFCSQFPQDITCANYRKFKGLE